MIILLFTINVLIVLFHIILICQVQAAVRVMKVFLAKLSLMNLHNAKELVRYVLKVTIIVPVLIQMDQQLLVNVNSSSLTKSKKILILKSRLP
jgi:hypothetical protein